MGWWERFEDAVTPSDPGPRSGGLWAGAAAVPLGFGLLLFYVLLTGKPGPAGPYAGSDLLDVVQSFVRHYGNVHFAVPLEGASSPPDASTAWHRLKTYPVQFAIPVVATSWTIWQIRKRGDLSLDYYAGGRRFGGGCMIGYGGLYGIVAVFSGAYVPMDMWELLSIQIVGLFAPVAGLSIASLAAGLRDRWPDTEGRPETASAESDSAPSASSRESNRPCHDCGRPAGSGTLCPHCGADL